MAGIIYVILKYISACARLDLYLNCCAIDMYLGTVVFFCKLLSVIQRVPANVLCLELFIVYCSLPTVYGLYMWLKNSIITEQEKTNKLILV